MAVPVWTLNEVLASADVNAWLVPSAVYKTGTQTVTSNATPVNDTQLFLPVAASAVYRVKLIIIYNADTTGDLRTGWTFPAGASITQIGCALISSAAAATDDVMVAVAASASPAAGPGSGGLGAGTNLAMGVWALLTTSTTAGTLQFQFAQLTSSGVATSVLAGSHLILQRIG